VDENWFLLPWVAISFLFLFPDTTGKDGTKLRVKISFIGVKRWYKAHQMHQGS
jgi:hypothetical protein